MFNYEINPAKNTIPERIGAVPITTPLDNSKVGFLVMKTKKCNRCKETKPLSDFYIYKGKYVYGSCRMCTTEVLRKYFRTKAGVVARIYSNQKNNSKGRNYPMPVYTQEQLKDWIFSQDNFTDLYNSWVESGYDRFLTPSCDRIDDYKSYTLDNLQLVTWDDNMRRGHLNQINGINTKRCKAVIQYTLDGKKVNEYYSLNNAERETGINHGDISCVCQGKSNTAGGYLWRYKHKNKATQYIGL